MGTTLPLLQMEVHQLWHTSSLKGMYSVSYATDKHNHMIGCILQRMHPFHSHVISIIISLHVNECKLASWTYHLVMLYWFKTCIYNQCVNSWMLGAKLLLSSVGWVMHGSVDLLDLSVFCFILCTSILGMHIYLDMLLSYFLHRFD